MRNQVLRPQASCVRLSMAVSTFYDHIARKILPPTIKFGPRAVGHLAHEIDAIIDARIAGQSEEEIKELVTKLIAARKNTPGRADQFVSQLEKQRESTDARCHAGAIQALSKA